MSDEMDHEAIARRWDKADSGAPDSEQRLNREEVAARWDRYAQGDLTAAPLAHDDGQEHRGRRRRRSAELNNVLNADGNLI